MCVWERVSGRLLRPSDSFPAFLLNNHHQNAILLPRPIHAPIFQTFVGWSSSGEIASRHLSLGALLLVGDTAGGDALDDVLAVLVELELGDFHLGGRDANGDGLAVGLLAGDALNVNDVLEAVHRGDLALTTLVGAALDDDLVVLADGDGADLD